MPRRRRRAYVNYIADPHAVKAFVESHQVRGTDLHGEISEFVQSNLKDWEDRPHLKVAHGLSGPHQVEIAGARTKIYRFSMDLLAPARADKLTRDVLEKRELFFSTNDRGQLVNVIRETLEQEAK
jgi:hypothetical protein